MILRLATALMLLFAPWAAAEVVTFPAADGVTVTADYTAVDGDTAIVLFHMAGASRGEYADIAPRLQKLGYTTMAVDQRSGGAFGGVENATRQAFASNPGFKDAIPDLQAAVAEIRRRGAQRVAVIGSSYSAALVIRLAGEDPSFAEAVISFSPGEYFRPSDFIRQVADKVRAPIFITAARNEEPQWREIFERLASSEKTGFVPKGPGRHGATALLSADGAEYWAALEAFLAAHFPPK